MKILIIRLSSIGDIVLTSPLLKAFKQKYPDTVIDYLVASHFAEVIEDNPYVDTVIKFDKSLHNGIFDLRKYAKELKKNNYDYVFDLHSNIRSKFLIKFLNIKTYSYYKRPLWQSIMVKLKLINYNVTKTIVRRYFDVVSDFGVKYSSEDLEFYFKEKDMLAVKDYAGFPVIAPAASKLNKEWKEEYYGELISYFYDKYGIQFILIGSKADIAKCDRINEISDGKAINLAGKITLKESGALLSKAKFMLGSDSGPFHIARGVGCPTYVIFASTSPKLFEYGTKDHVIHPKGNWAPYSLYGDNKIPRGQRDFMEEIKAEEVIELIENTQVF